VAHVNVGPANGTVRVHTYRDGVGRTLGHDLTIAVNRWHATVELGDDGYPVRVTFDADPRSLRVLEGSGRVPLTDLDRSDILRNIDRDVLRGRPITFRSTSVERTAQRLRVTGDLTLVHATRRATFELDATADGHLSGRLAVTQSEWGIAPFSAPGGLLRLRDAIEVTIDVRLFESS
jgi:polyisoprenoid-binding protein YceI